MLFRIFERAKIGSTVYYRILASATALRFARTQAGRLPHSERAAQEVLSLPMYPELRKEQIGRVAKAIAEFLKC
jgi:dTDP-4-amino-4,6-dideoxygalactose transaminase